MDISYILDNYEKYGQMLKKRFIKTELLEQIKEYHKLYVAEVHIYNKLGQLKNKLVSAIRQNKHDGITQFPENTFNENTTHETILSYMNSDLILYSKTDLIEMGKILKVITAAKQKSMNDLFVIRNEYVYKMPNLLDDRVVISNNEEHNPCLKTYIHDSTQTQNLPFDQYQLCLKLGIIEDASMIAGNRGYFLTGAGVRLNYALINYALDFVSKKGYKLMYTPHFMNKTNMANVCQLSEFEDSLYELKDDNKFLIATSEQPLTSYFENKTVTGLPIRLAGISTCYRKEASAHGKDTLGIFRVHQFEKVEQFCVTDNKTSNVTMDDMIEVAQEFYESLGLSYRVISIVSGALNNAASIKYDLEGWFAGSGKFRELVSCSNTTDYFSRRLSTKQSNGEHVHMLNSTLCANTRTLCCILETYQTDTGVAIPKVLQKYMNDEIIEFVI
jgi:seryl-tRNA synthetase